MKRSTPLKRTTPLRSRSKKMASRYAGKGGRRALVARLLNESKQCDALTAFHRAMAGVDPYTWDPVIVAAFHACRVRPRDVHELLSRSAGGDILDEKNLICVCRVCHDWLHHHPRLALQLGLRRSRYAHIDVIAETTEAGHG